MTSIYRIAAGAMVASVFVGCQGDLEVQRLLSTGSNSSAGQLDSGGADENNDADKDHASTDRDDGSSQSQDSDGSADHDGQTDDGDSADATTSDIGDDGATDEPQTPSATVFFAKDIQPIFNTYCIRCHVTGGFANQSGIPLKLVDGSSYRLLVNQASAQRNDLKLVRPSHPDESLLYMKLTQDPPPVGVRMPWDRGPAPTEDEVQKIRTWISEGAQFN